MDTENELIYQRMSLYRLLEEHPEWRNRRCAQALAHSEKWVRKWRKRFKNAGTDFPHLFQRQKRPPRIHPQQIADEVKDAIGDLRVDLSEKYHRKAGPRLIRAELKKLEHLQNFHLPSSTRTIAKILHELGYLQKRAKPQHIPLDPIPPMTEWEMDFGEVYVPHEGVFEFLLVVDRGTSRVVYVEGKAGYNAESALEALLRLFVLHGLPQRLRFDRDPRFVASWTTDSYPSPLIRFLRVLGVEPVICPPRRPDLKPFVERCIGTLKHEWLARFPWETAGDIQEILPEFLYYHNADRLHFGRACQGRTPDEAFPVLPQLPSLPDQVQPNRWLNAYHGRIFRRRVSSNGTIQIDKHTYSVGTRWAKQGVLVELDAHTQLFHVWCDGQLIQQLPVQGLHEPSLDFFTYFRLICDEARSIEGYRYFHWQQPGEVA